jgi:uncharacterized protein (DUF2252 family)
MLMNIVQNIQLFNAEREPERLILKYRAMRLNPFVFLRGTCHLFYDRLANEPVLNAAPATWVCGDLHLENFGSYKGDNRLTYFDLNDFDEAALAPLAWELTRCLTSILVGAESLLIKRAEALTLCEQFLSGYTAALASGKARWIERDTADGLIKQLLDKQRNRLRPAFLDSRTELKGSHRKIRLDGKKAVEISATERCKVTEFMEKFSRNQPIPEFYQVLDVARRIAGTGSLGVARYIILVAGKGSPDQNYLLDLKQALPSSLIPHVRTKQPQWKTEAHRVVGVQQQMQSVSMAFLHAVMMDKQPYVLRALQPSEDRVNLSTTQNAAQMIESVLRHMGGLVAWGQLRSSGRGGSAIADELIDFALGKKWQKSLMDLAQQCQKQVEKDYLRYAQAFDDGAFNMR